VIHKNVQWRDAFIVGVERRMFEESLPRLVKCVRLLSEEEIWYRPNKSSNSVGNLVLHLCGNVRQWILTGFAHELDTRKRQQEFDEQGPIAADVLLAQLDEVMGRVEEAVKNISAQQLLEVRKIQGFDDETGMTMLMHVVEHFSYHVGQVSYITKSIKDADLGYYEDQDLDVTK